MRYEFSRAVRDATLLRAHYRCERCSSCAQLVLHHRGHPRDNSAFNAVVLCVDCHKAEHDQRLLRQCGRRGGLW
jgi:5-methylcytosine-specific restriction endonuclease McrA